MELCRYDAIHDESTPMRAIVTRTRKVAHEYAQVGKEIKATLAKLGLTTDFSERKLLLANINMLLVLANRLAHQHHEQIGELLDLIDLKRSRGDPV